MNDVEWVRVVETNGITPAEMLANELNAAGIPARAVQEGAGVALGLTVGILGTAVVVVPAQYLAEAQALLDVEETPEEDDVPVICPHCGADVELDDAEWEQGWFICPSCENRVDLEDVD